MNRSLGVLWILVLVVGCDDETLREPPPVCEPGETQWCACAGGRTGVQICAAAGQGWGPCQQCNAAPAPDSGGSSDGWTPPGPTPDAGVSPPVDAAPPPSTAKPIMIAAGHYLTYKSQLGGLGPFIVYGWAADPSLGMYTQQLQVLAQISDPGVTKMVMFSSLKTAQSKLADPSHVSYLKSIGVGGLGYNTEGDKTPASEMQSLAQSVSQLAALAQSHGLDLIWGPIRVTADQTSDAAYGQMITAGLDGVGLQEQKWIESACVPQRGGAVKQLSSRLKQLAQGKAFQVQVQIMPSRCLSGDSYAQASCGSSGPKFHHCQAFADAIAPAVDSLAIWASSAADNAELVPLIKALRHK